MICLIGNYRCCIFFVLSCTTKIGCLPFVKAKVFHLYDDDEHILHFTVFFPSFSFDAKEKIFFIWPHTHTLIDIIYRWNINYRNIFICPMMMKNTCHNNWRNGFVFFLLFLLSSVCVKIVFFFLKKNIPKSTNQPIDRTTDKNWQSTTTTTTPPHHEWIRSNKTKIVKLEN